MAYTGNATGPELILPGGGAYVVDIHDDCTLMVDADVDVEYESFSITGSGKLTLAGEGKITAGSVSIADGITLVNCGQLNSAPVSVATNAVFEIAAPMTWTNAISGAGGVRVSADEVVFNKQSTFTGGLTVAPGGRARSNVGASLGGGGGGGYGGDPTFDSGISANRFYGNVTVESGGAADMIHNHYLSCYSLSISGTGINGSGAAFRSGGINDPENQPHAMALTLTDDATVSANNAWGLVAPGFGATQLNLAGHRLTVTGSNNFLLCNTTINGTGTIEIADGATLKTINKGVSRNNATCDVKNGGRLHVSQNTTFSNVVCEAGGAMTFGNNKTLTVLDTFTLPSEGYVTIDISALSDIAVGETKTLVEWSSATAETDVSRLLVAGKTGYHPKSVAGTGIVVEHSNDIPDNLIWSNGSWNVGSENMSQYSEATIVLSGGENVVELPTDLSLDRVAVSAASAATASFSGHTATVANLVIGENVTFVSNGKFAVSASPSIDVASNALFSVASQMTYSGRITGAGTVRVEDGAKLTITSDNVSATAATCRITGGGILEIGGDAKWLNVICEEGGTLTVNSGKFLKIPGSGNITVNGTANVDGTIHLGENWSSEARLEVGGIVNVTNLVFVSGGSRIVRTPGTSGVVNITESGRVEYDNTPNPWTAEDGDVFAGAGRIVINAWTPIVHTIAGSTFSGSLELLAATWNGLNILGGPDGAMFSGTPELVANGAICLGSWYDAEGRSFGVKDLSGSGTFNADREQTSAHWTNVLETTQTKDTLFSGRFIGETCAFGLNVKGADELHTLTLSGASTTPGTLAIADKAKIVFTSTGSWANGKVSVANGAYLEVTNESSVASVLQMQSGSTLKIAAKVENNVTNAVPVAVEAFTLPDDGCATVDIADVPELEAGVAQMLISCQDIASDMDLSHLSVIGKTDYRLKAEVGGIVAVRLPDNLVWSNGVWNVDSEDMSRYSEATIVLSEGTNEVAVADGLDFNSVSVSATAPGTLLFTGGTAEIGGLDLGENVTYVHTGTVSNGVVYVRSGAGIASECDGLVADAVSLAMGTTVYRGAKTVNASTIYVSTGGGVPLFSAQRLRGSGNESGVLIRNTTGEDPSGLWRVVGGRWSEPRPDADVFVFEPELPQDAGDRVVADDGLYFARASFTASTGEVSAHESAQDAADAAKGKGGKVTVLAGGESISLGAGWFSTGASIIVPAGVVGVTVTAAGIVIGGKDSGDDGSKKYDEEEEARAEVVETGKKYASLALAKSHLGDEPCTFRLLAESRDSIHLATASEESGQTLLLNNWPYSGTVTGASANLAAGASVKSYYAILSAAKSAWTSGDTINLLSDGERYSVPNGKTLVLDGEKTYAVAKPFDLNGTLTVGGCTFTASAGITINAGTLKAAKANCTLIGSGTEVTLREGGVKVDTDGYSADIAAALTVAGGLQNKPVILKAGLANLRLSGGVVGGSVITIQSGCGKVFAPSSSDCEPGDYTQISEQDAEWATFENGIAVANLVKADGSSTAYSSMNAAGAAAQLNPTYRYIEVLVNNQTLRCLPTMGVIRVKYDNAVFVFKVQSLAQDWTFDEVYGVAFSVFTPVHKATDYVWNGGEDGDWETITNWKYNLALDYDLPIATRMPDTNDTVIIRADGMPEAGWSACIGSSGGACKEIKVDEGAKLTLSYSSLGCDMTKTDPGVIIVTNAWTSGTPTITVKAGGGTVTLPKTAAYTRGTDTVVVTETDDTVTLGFAGDITDPYAAWAAEHGITGAWDEADETGVYNVFRYLFDKATGDFRIIDISFDAEGNVVITTAEVVNPEGFAVSVVETSDVAGNSVTDEKAIATSSNTATFTKSAPVRFYRVKAVRTGQ